MPVRGIRGATTIVEDQPEAILTATRELLTDLLEANPTLNREDIASAIFTVSEDISAAYPAQAAREIGWTEVPMLCGREIPVPGGLPFCIRVLIHWNTDLPQSSVCHIYRNRAVSLRPDLTFPALEQMQVGARNQD